MAETCVAQMVREDLAMTCDRTGCDSHAAWRVLFDAYPNSSNTIACYKHAVWWVCGFDGQVLGKAVPHG